MHNLLFTLSSITISKISWFDVSTFLSVIAFCVYIYRFARSRVTKDDLDTELGKKASKSMVESEFKLRDVRIDNVEKLAFMSDNYLKDTLEEHHSILDTVQHDIKEILKRLK